MIKHVPAYKHRHIIVLRIAFVVAMSCAALGAFADGPASIKEWLERLSRDRYWTENSLPQIAAVHKGGMTLEPSAGERYRQAIFHAITVLAQAGEDPVVAATCRKFGINISYGHVAANGEFTLDGKPDANKVVDDALELVRPAIEAALADLAQIPDDWSGRILFSPESYPVDEDVYVDIGDVMYVRAMLKAVLFAIHYCAAYNVEIDYDKLASERTEIVVVDEQPTVSGDVWNRVPELDLKLRSGYNIAESIKLAIYEDHVYVLAKSATAFKSSIYFTFECTLAGKWWSEVASPLVRVSGSGNGPLSTYGIRDVRSCWAYASEPSIMLRFDVSGLSRKELHETRYLNGYDFRGYVSGNDGRGFYYYEQYWYKGWQPKKYYNAVLNQPKVLDRVRDASLLAAAKVSLKDSLQLALAADSHIWDKRGAGNYLFNYAAADVTPGRHRAIRDLAEKALASLASVQTYDHAFFSSLGEHGVENPLSFCLGALFGGGITRALLPQRLCADGADGFDVANIPDPTFGGILPAMTAAKWQFIGDLNNWNSYTIRFDRGNAPMAYDYQPMEDMKCASGQVYKLRMNQYSWPGHRFVGWRIGYYGKICDDGMLVFNLARPGKIVTLIAIWE